jgi:putative ABC transport system permease protein
MNIDYSNKIETYTTIPGPLGDAIRPVIPEVVNTTRMGYDQVLFGLRTRPPTKTAFAWTQASSS